METDPSQTNPFAAPTADITGRPFDLDSTPEEAIRHEYLKREHSIKSIGSLFVVFSLVLGVAVISLAGPLISSFQRGANSSRGLAVAIATLVLLGFLITGQLLVGIGIRRLKPWSRIPAIVISVLWMFHFPIGTVLNVIFLVTLLGKRNRFVFTPEYRRIIEATPHIKYRSSILLWAVLIIFGALLLAIGLSAVLITNDLK